MFEEISRIQKQVNNTAAFDPTDKPTLAILLPNKRFVPA
jgi:hypothetical protein